jgi:hypothetical protein
MFWEEEYVNCDEPSACVEATKNGCTWAGSFYERERVAALICSMITKTPSSNRLILTRSLHCVTCPWQLTVWYSSSIWTMKTTEQDCLKVGSDTFWRG